MSYIIRNKPVETVAGRTAVSADKVLETVRTIFPQEVHNRLSIAERSNYFVVLVDNNKHRSLFRLYNNDIRKSIGLFNAHNVETKFRFGEAGDILFYATAIKTRAVKFI